VAEFPCKAIRFSIKNPSNRANILRDYQFFAFGRKKICQRLMYEIARIDYAWTREHVVKLVASGMEQEDAPKSVGKNVASGRRPCRRDPAGNSKARNLICGLSLSGMVSRIWSRPGLPGRGPARSRLL
jgi:hypothetical protein